MKLPRLILLGMLFLPGMVRLAQGNDTNFVGELRKEWKSVPLKFDLQHPYDLKAADRHAFDATNNIHDFWIFFSDKPHAPPPNKTTARSEMRLETFRTGEHLFTADVNVRPGTFACIAQVFDANHGPVTMLIAHPDGSVTAGETVVATNVIGRWWNLKITVDPTPGGRIHVYADNALAGVFRSHGPRDYYFKCGVYARHGSDRSEACFRNIEEWVRADPPPTQSK